MDSVWGVDHGDEVSKKFGMLRPKKPAAPRLASSPSGAPNALSRQQGNISKANASPKPGLRVPSTSAGQQTSNVRAFGNTKFGQGRTRKARVQWRDR
jgi:hypothetical protein